METVLVTVTTVAGVLSVVVAVFAAKYAAGQLKIARQIREDAAQPYVYAEVGVSVTSPQLVVLLVKNTGQTAAKDVHVWADPPIRHYEGEIATEWKIASLGPGGYLERPIGSGTEFFNRKDRPSRVTVHVSAKGPFGPFEESYEIDLDEYQHKLGASMPMERIAKNTEAMVEELKRR